MQEFNYYRVIISMYSANNEVGLAIPIPPVEWKLPINYTFHPGGFEMLAEITLTIVPPTRWLLTTSCKGVQR